MKRSEKFCPQEAEKAEETQNITSDDDPNIDENQFFFNKELKGGSVGNPKAQKEAEAELTKIKDKAEETQNLKILNGRGSCS